jgi:isoamylase
VDATGVNFAVFSQHASAVTLCLFDASGEREIERVPLSACTDGVWHGHVAGMRAGQVYGYRVEGPFAPERGHRFDPSKLLIDPYARQFIGEFNWRDTNETLKSVVVAPDQFNWGDDSPPAIKPEHTVLYEAHVKGFTQQHPDIAPELRGTFEGFAADPAIAHLQQLGVTSVSLLPVQQAISERALVLADKVNYWGYNTIGFFAPDRRFARHEPIGEFKSMVKRLHAAGIEVILDVVYNHTPEGDHTGPTLAFKGLDNACYYHLRSENRAFYENFTGTGNALNLSHPRVLQMVMDSLRYWVQEMHVDGFRFDLATTLARGEQGFNRRANFFDCIAQDPVLARVKLIAEPWDVGFDGYQTGRFPPGWSEWNDRYRDSVRSFWVRKAAYRGELAGRLAGSSEMFRYGGRSAHSSINFVTAHDGFTLHDLVSYDQRHNEANGEDNRDGSPENRSWNCGVEGPSDSLEINALRGRLKRALLATLFVSQGTPMLLAGDELGRTQQGNNNAYCQDNPLSWFNWAAARGPSNQELTQFVARLIKLRRRYPQLHRPQWLSGALTALGDKDVLWLNRQGEEMNQRQWQEWGRFAFGFMLGATTPNEPKLLVLLNGEANPWPMPLPAGQWTTVLNSAQPDGTPNEGEMDVDGSLLLPGRSLCVLEENRGAVK